VVLSVGGSVTEFEERVISGLSELAQGQKATNWRLDTLNGSVARHERYIQRHELEHAGENGEERGRQAVRAGDRARLGLAWELITHRAAWLGGGLLLGAAARWGGW